MRDAWEHSSFPPLYRTPEYKTKYFGRYRCHTAGHYCDGNIPDVGGTRFDKFLYTGAIETLPVAESDDIVSKVGRLGIGLTAKFWVFDDGTRPGGEIISDEMAVEVSVAMELEWKIHKSGIYNSSFTDEEYAAVDEKR